MTKLIRFKKNNENTLFSSENICISREQILSNALDYSNGTRVIGNLGTKVVYRTIVDIGAYASSYQVSINGTIDKVLNMSMVVHSTTDNAYRNIPWLYSGSISGNQWYGGYYFVKSSKIIYMQIDTELRKYDSGRFVVEYTLGGG